MPRCQICSTESAAADCQQLSPRQLAGMKVVASSVQAAAIKAVAQSIIVYDNPKDAADTPLFCVCKACLGREFGPGDYARDIAEARRLKKLIRGERRKSEKRPWWRFW